MSFTYRENQNSPLTWAQLDGNFREVEIVQQEVFTQVMAAAASAETATEAKISSQESAELAEEMARISVVRWCGNHTEAPTTRLDGSPLEISDEYGNLSDNLRYNWTGTAWVALNSSAQQLEERLGDPGFGGRMVNSRLRGLAAATARSLGDRADDHISFLDFLSPEQRADVESFTGSIDCTDAWDKMLLSLKYPGPSLYPGTPRIKMPGGIIFFASEKIVRQRILIKGEGDSQALGNYGTTFKFPADCSGLTFIKGSAGPTVNGSDLSMLEGVHLAGGGINSGARTKHGVDFKAPVELRDVSVTGFSGNGVNIVADVSGKSNANRWGMNNVRLGGNGMHGMYVQGGDTNAGIAIKVNASGNNRSGIYDASFLGNTYIACHTATNGLQCQVYHDGSRYYCASDTLGGSTTPGTDATVWVSLGAAGPHATYPNWVSGGEYYIGYGYRSTNANSNSVFLSCYFEQGQPLAQIMRPAMVIGGNLSAHALRDPSSTALFLTSGGGVTDLVNAPNGADYTFAFGSKSERAAFGLYANGDNGITHQWEPTTGVWAWKWANLNAGRMSYMTTAITTITGGRSAPVGGGVQGFSKPFIMGTRHFGQVYWTSGTTNPTTGEFARGDSYLFSAVAAGGKLGITCTTSGNAGSTAVFKQWGAIDA